MHQPKKNCRKYCRLRLIKILISIPIKRHPLYSSKYYHAKPAVSAHNALILILIIGNQQFNCQ